ncbi:WD40 repeat-like protein [Leucogyrophana mollusca]|uniref:WD40 repeat-like protein n=1 Tax=Leucogyrophana mollusca TaxID=85980 RepID=A0ACB8BPF5_9AGAM|nr:WD40 repeat-like protein [Leucogyrophana mollusca]
MIEQVLPSHRHYCRLGLGTLRKASVTSAAFDSAERYPAPACLPGTRVELLRRISEWIAKKDGEPICWLNGLAGSGKSAVAQSVAERYAGQQRLAASFFFSRRELERSTTQHFFPTIACQIMAFMPSIKPAIVAALDKDYTIPSKVLSEQMQKLLLVPLSGVEESPSLPALIVVDSLDECHNEVLVAELITQLARLIRECQYPLRILLTSRTESHIGDKFHEPEICSMTYPLELLAFDPEEDIRTFLMHAFNAVYDQHRRIMSDIPRPWPPLSEMETLVKKASGLFIFATTIVKFVGSKHHDPQLRLRHMFDDNTTTFSDLDFLYHEVVQTFPDVDMARTVLGIICYISSPLSTRSLTSLLSPLQINAMLVISNFSSVVLIPEDETQPVRIYHASFRDFLSSPQRSKQYFVDPATYHRLLTRLCLELMIKRLKRDICNIGDPSKLNNEVEDLPARCIQYIGDAVRYACCNWAYHLTQVQHDETLDDIMGLLETFSRTAVLYWAETLSLIGELDNAVLILREAIRWLNLLSTPPTIVVTLFKDMERLVLMFFDPISQSALHVYHTALPFAPTNTPLRKEFQRELAGSFAVTRGLDDRWGAFVRIIRPAGRTVLSQAFSPDMRLTACASVDQGVELWSTITGSSVADLGPHPSHKPSCAVITSPSGSCVSVAFEDGLVIAWDVATGRIVLRNEECHQEPVTSLSFSPNSKLLASASRKSIHLLEVETGQSVHRFDHSDDVLALVFSVDGELIISGTTDGLGTIWETTSGRLLQRLKGHTASVNSVSISSDNAIVASGSADKAVRIWNTQTGACLRTYSNNHPGGINYVFFTPDDRNVISICDKLVGSCTTSSSSSFVRLWSADKFALDVAMAGLTRLEKMVYSRLPWNTICSRLIGDADILENVSQKDPTIHVMHSSRSISVVAVFNYMLCLASVSPKREPVFYSCMDEDIIAPASSPDGSQFVCAGSWGIVEILDSEFASNDVDEVNSFKHNKTYFRSSLDGSRYVLGGWRGDEELVDADGLTITKLKLGWRVGFSADSSTLVSLNQRHLDVFSTTTGQRIKRFTVAGSTVDCYALSADGSWVACVHDDHNIQLWEVSSGRTMPNIVAQHISTSIIAFSPDQSKLLCGSREGRMQLWDVRTGQLQAEIQCSSNETTSMAFSPTGTVVAFGCNDGCVYLWSPSSGTSHALASPPPETSPRPDSPFSDACPVTLLKFSDDGGTLKYRSARGYYAQVVITLRVPSHLPSKQDGESTLNNDSCDICSPREGCDQLNAHLVSRLDESGRSYDYQMRSDYMVSHDDGWVYHKERRIIWLPHTIRPRYTSIAAYNGVFY